MIKIYFDRFICGFQSISWVVDVAAEIYRGFRELDNIGPCVTVFGSARLTEHNPNYKMVQQLGRDLAKSGFTVLTGGGPGLMAAANSGAKEAGGTSIGCRINLVKHEPANFFVDKSVSFKHFFVRKIMLRKYSMAFIAAPGGFGTLDEVFEIVTLVQTGKINKVPIYFMNTAYWKPIIEFAKKEMIHFGTIDLGDLSLIRYSDDPAEIVAAIKGQVAEEKAPEERVTEEAA